MCWVKSLQVRSWYLKSAEQGQAAAQYNFGMIYRFGQGVEQSDDEVLKWYRLAEAQGVDMNELINRVLNK